jgi:hypothetical protein
VSGGSRATSKVTPLKVFTLSLDVSRAGQQIDRDIFVGQDHVPPVPVR